MKLSDIPPTYKLTKGYQAMIWCPSGGAKGWTPLSNSWGYPYTYKGFAINKCKAYQYYNFHKDSFFQVIELSSSEVVWQSPNLIELGFNN
tara:strand:+ start:8207 stop:8476 length:270 start_codon:yes stop_codon:yes gene_type:complete